MNEELKKALESLIDETISEIEELKKSRFSASEIKIEGPGQGIDGEPSDGHLGKDEDEDEKKDEKDEDDSEVEKAANREADPDGGHHKMDKAEVEKAANREADPDGGHHKMDKAEDKKKDEKEPHKDDDKHEEKEKKMAQKLLDMHKDEMGYGGAIRKSEEELGDLMKSFIDQRVAPLESKLSSILDLVNRIADQPVAPRGVTAKMQPLAKSGEFTETLSKSEAAKKLFELKKSGTPVDTLDIAKAEQGVELQAIVKKYNLA